MKRVEFAAGNRAAEDFEKELIGMRRKIIDEQRFSGGMRAARFVGNVFSDCGHRSPENISKHGAHGEHGENKSTIELFLSELRVLRV
jgi:hypothetical protein